MPSFPCSRKHFPDNFQRMKALKTARDQAEIITAYRHPTKALKHKLSPSAMLALKSASHVLVYKKMEKWF